MFIEVNKNTTTGNYEVDTNVAVPTVEANKAATIDVSTYTDPVEITPTAGNDAMTKATVTLSNIPEIEANKAQTIDVSQYSNPIEIEPTTGKSGMAKATVTLSNIPSGGDVESNKDVTIDVSSYTIPIEVIPTAGKDSMAKATITLDNIPSGGSITYRAWKASTNDYVAYAYVKDGVDIQVGMSSESITGFNVRTTGICSEGAFVNTIKSVSEDTIVTNSGTPFLELTWTRDSSADITI